MATPTDICNLALDRIGEPMISDFAENSPNAITCRRHYETVRDSLLRSHPWNFATGRAQLTADASAPDFGYSYSYQLPADCLRELTLNGVEAKRCESSYTIEGRKLLTDASEARITYVKKVEDPNDFDSLFSDVLAFRLAAAIAVSVTGSESKRDGMEQMAALRLNDASFVDANETSPRVLSPLRSGRRSRSNDFRDYGNAPDAGVDLDNGADGADGWTPSAWAVYSDGERRVLKIAAWTGGEGDEPETGYLGVSGIVASAATAIDIRGATGPIGPFGTNLHVGDTEPEDPEGFPLWWKSDIGLLFIWYDDGTSEQWVSAVGAGPVGPSAYQSYLNTTADDPPLSEEQWSSPLSEIVDLEDFGSGSATNNHVLTADGSGGAAWEAIPDQTPADGSVTNAKMANMAAGTTKGRALGSGTGVPVDLTAAQQRANAGLDTTDDVAFLTTRSTASGNSLSTIVGTDAVYRGGLGYDAASVSLLLYWSISNVAGRMGPAGFIAPPAGGFWWAQDNWQGAAHLGFIRNSSTEAMLADGSSNPRDLKLRTLILDKTITAAATTGAQTINKSAGSVNFAAAATSLVVTNSLVTTSSVIHCTIATNDTTMTTLQVVAGSGSFTIYAPVAPTAETRVNFFLTN